MAVDRDKRSVATNKLGGFIAISFCVLSTCVLQLVAISDLDQPPTSVTTFLGETASFNCSIRKGDILWYVDDMFIVSVPSEYGASYMAGSSMANCITSTLHIRAIEQTNNSLIQCAVGVDGNLNRTYFPSTAHLLVQGPPMPPPNLQVTIIHTNMHLLIIDLIWEEPTSLINNSITNYTVRLNVSLVNETSDYLFLDYETTTTETSDSLVYNISHHGNYLCSMFVVTVDVLAQNKVGIGGAASLRKTALPNIDSELCTSSSVVAPSSVLSITVTPPVHPGLKAVSSRANTNRMLIYGAVGGVLSLVVLLLLVTTAVTITSVHLISRRRKKGGAKSVNKSEPKIQVSHNEAYASVELHKPEEMHIYEEPSIATENQGTVITTRNEAYASWTMQHNNQLLL